MRLHGIRPGEDGNVIATYDDRPEAHTAITAEEAKREFLGRCDREIERHRRELAEWRSMKAATEELGATDFRPR